MYCRREDFMAGWRSPKIKKRKHLQTKIIYNFIYSFVYLRKGGLSILPSGFAKKGLIKSLLKIYLCLDHKWHILTLHTLVRTRNSFGKRWRVLSRNKSISYGNGKSKLNNPKRISLIKCQVMTWPDETKTNVSWVVGSNQHISLFL